MEWIDYLRILKNQSGMTTKELSTVSAIPEPTLEKIFSGQTKNPGVNSIQRLVHAMGYTLNDIDPQKQKNTPSLSNEALQVAIDYSDLDKPGKRAVRVTLDDQRRRVKEETNKRNNSVDFIYLPWNDQPASAGTGFFLDNERMVEWKVIHNELTRKADFCLDVQGDSMEPKFFDGDTILVRRQPSVDIGEIGLFIVDGKGYVKMKTGGCRKNIDISTFSHSICTPRVRYRQIANKKAGQLSGCPALIRLHFRPDHRQHVVFPLVAGGDGQIDVPLLFVDGLPLPAGQHPSLAVLRCIDADAAVVNQHIPRLETT